MKLLWLYSILVILAKIMDALQGKLHKLLVSCSVLLGQEKA
jgi:hypothetical protein